MGHQQTVHAVKHYYQSTVFLSDCDDLPDTFAILTACNPMDRQLSNEENESRTTRLRKILQQEGHDHYDITGCSPDLTHQEPGFAVSVPMSTALSLANEFRQLAIYWVESDQVALISCVTSESINLGSFRDRLLGRD